MNSPDYLDEDDEAQLEAALGGGGFFLPDMTRRDMKDRAYNSLYRVRFGNVCFLDYQTGWLGSCFGPQELHPPHFKPISRKLALARFGSVIDAGEGQ